MPVLGVSSLFYVCCVLSMCVFCVYVGVSLYVLLSCSLPCCSGWSKYLLLLHLMPCLFFVLWYLLALPLYILALCFAACLCSIHTGSPLVWLGLCRACVRLLFCVWLSVGACCCLCVCLCRGCAVLCRAVCSWRCFFCPRASTAEQ